MKLDTLDCEEDGLGGFASVAVNMYKLCAPKEAKIHGKEAEKSFETARKQLENSLKSP